MRGIVKWSGVLVLLGFSLILNGCNGVSYTVKVANYGEYGVILHKMPTQFIPNERKKHPGIPGVRDDISVLGGFHNHPDSLPDQIEVEWQLAELRDCREIIRHKSFVYQTADEKIYARKSSCTWIPLEDKVYRKVIDLKAIQESEHAKRSGETISLGQTRVLNILFMIRDEDLEISFGSHVHNAWR